MLRQAVGLNRIREDRLKTHVRNELTKGCAYET